MLKLLQMNYHFNYIFSDTLKNIDKIKSVLTHKNLKSSTKFQKIHTLITVCVDEAISITRENIIYTLNYMDEDAENEYLSSREKFEEDYGSDPDLQQNSDGEYFF